MKVLVTGGAGFIGSHVVDQYLQHGYEVAVVDDLSRGRAVNLNPAAAFYQLDIRSPDLAEVFEKERPDYVNHHAAQVDVRRSVAQPLFDADVNVLGSINLIECANRYPVKRFVYVSTGGAVYGEPEYLPCDEGHPINPICQYGISKHTVEHYLYLYHANYGLNYTVLRYSNVYGPRQDPNGEAGVVAVFSGQMLAGKPVTINGDGEQQRDFVYVGDCAQANLLALTQEAGSGTSAPDVTRPSPAGSTPNRAGVYNVGSGRATSVNEVFQRLKAITGYGQPPVYGPAKIGETRRIYLDARKARQELGWLPAVSLEDGLANTVAYFKAVEHAL